MDNGHKCPDAMPAQPLIVSIQFVAISYAYNGRCPVSMPDELGRVTRVNNLHPFKN